MSGYLVGIEGSIVDGDFIYATVELQTVISACAAARPGTDQHWDSAAVALLAAKDAAIRRHEERRGIEQAVHVEECIAVRLIQHTHDMVPIGRIGADGSIDIDIGSIGLPEEETEIDPSAPIRHELLGGGIAFGHNCSVVAH